VITSLPIINDNGTSYRALTFIKYRIRSALTYKFILSWVL